MCAVLRISHLKELKMSSGMLKSAAVLGLLAAVGPFAIDMYLPALPTVATDLDGSIAAAQLTLTAYFMAFGIAQLVYGPLADQMGRKPPLYIGLAVFSLASIGCAFASSIETLTVFRFLQGLGAAVTMVIPRAIIRDLHTGTEATRLMALIMMVISVSPMLAPLAGSGVIHVWSWRAIFVILCVAAVASLFLTSFLLPETLQEKNRVPVNMKNLLSGAKTLLKDKTFMGLTFIGGFGMASFFVFLASASFVYTGQFGLTPVGFSLAFAINAIGFFAASQLAANFGERFGMAATVLGAALGFLFFTGLLLVITLAGYGSLYVIVAMLFLANGCMGLIIPTTMVMALDDHGEMAGLASSLGGTLQMLTGGLMVLVASPFFDGTAIPMVVAISICGLLAFILAKLVLGKAAQPSSV